MTAKAAGSTVTAVPHAISWISSSETAAGVSTPRSVKRREMYSAQHGLSFQQFGESETMSADCGLQGCMLLRWLRFAEKLTSHKPLQGLIVCKLAEICGPCSGTKRGSEWCKSICSCESAAAGAPWGRTGRCVVARGVVHLDTGGHERPHVHLPPLSRDITLPKGVHSCKLCSMTGRSPGDWCLSSKFLWPELSMVITNPI